VPAEVVQRPSATLLRAALGVYTIDSKVAPVYYAHLAAAHARFFPNEGFDSVPTVGSNDSSLSNFEFTQPHDDHKNTMLFIWLWLMMDACCSRPAEYVRRAGRAKAANFDPKPALLPTGWWVIRVGEGVVKTTMVR
jgi:hypothetical protein